MSQYEYSEDLGTKLGEEARQVLDTYLDKWKLVENEDAMLTPTLNTTLNLLRTQIVLSDY